MGGNTLLYNAFFLIVLNAWQDCDLIFQTPTQVKWVPILEQSLPVPLSPKRFELHNHKVRELSKITMVTATPILIGCVYLESHTAHPMLIQPPPQKYPKK